MVDLPRGASATLVAFALLLATASCSRRADPNLEPDEVLRRELGLTLDDEVHRVTLAGGTAETLDPVTTELPPGAYVEFLSSDWWVHEVRFEADSLAEEALDFLRRTDQLASPPMIQKDSRFVLSFEGAPFGRYPFVVEGNGTSVRGAIVVVSGAAP